MFDAFQAEGSLSVCLLVHAGAIQSASYVVHAGAILIAVPLSQMPSCVLFP